MTDNQTTNDLINGHEHDSEIEMFIHCNQCIEETGGVHGEPYVPLLQVGWTRKGIQVWCRRHDRNIVHIDFMGQKIMYAKNDN